MTIGSATLVFEVQTGGSDSNGGGFDNGVGSPGTDYSQQASAQVAYTDLANGAAGNADKVTSAAHPFGATSPGNVINITGGTGFTTGLYRILSVSGTTATMDRDVGGLSLTGGTGNLGGALATVGKATNNMTVGGQLTYVKGGTYQITGSLNFPILTSGNAVSRIVGYTSTRGDNGQATIQINANSVTLATNDAYSDTSVVSWENLIFDGNNKTSSNGFNLVVDSAYSMTALINCIFKRFTGQYCIQAGVGALNLQACEFASNAFTTNNSACILSISNGLTGGEFTVNVSDCYFNGNSISSTNAAAVIWGGNMALSVQNCILYNNTGTKMDAIYLNNALVVNISNNAIHSNSRHGINIDCGISTAAAALLANIVNNIITSNGGWGINAAFTTSPTLVMVNHNAYYNNTSGAKTGFTAGAGEVSLTGLPYVNAPTDFSLNSTASQGLACRGAGIPGTLGVSATVGTGFMDLGPLPLFARMCV